MKPTMKTVILLSSTGLILAGLVLLNVGHREPESAWAQTAPTQGAGEAGLARLDERLNRMTERLDRMAARIDTLENAPVQPGLTGRVPAGLVEREEFDQLREQLMAMAASMADGSAAGAPLKADVAAALEEVRAAERSAKVEAKRAETSAKLDEQMPRYQQELGLTNSQTDRLRTVIEARDERVAEMMRLWQAGDREAAGALKGAENETYQMELQGVLNDQQVEQFRSMQGGRRGGK